MKTTAALVLISALSASAFVPVHKPATAQTSLQITKEEDIELTRKVIANFLGGDEAKAEPAPAAAEPEPEAPKKAKKGKGKN